MEKWNNYGESSLTLLAVHCRMDKKRPAVPQDPEDFVRCIHLFECLEFGEGEIFSLLCMTADKYPIWRNFSKEWDLLTDLYNEEKNNKIAPKLYKAIQDLTK